jgi:hypothetical protein
VSTNGSLELYRAIVHKKVTGWIPGVGERVWVRIPALMGGIIVEVNPPRAYSTSVSPATPPVGYVCTVAANSEKTEFYWVQGPDPSILATQTEGGFVPVATVIDFAGPVELVPDNYLWCAGQEVLKSEYPLLWARLSTTWGVASDPLKFKLPDLRDKSTIGSNEGFGDGPISTSVGDVLGSYTALLPQHNHTATFVGSALASHGHSGSTFTGTALGTHTHAMPQHVHTLNSHSHTMAHTHGPGTGTTFFTRTSGGGSLGVTVTDVAEQWFNPTTTAGSSAANTGNATGNTGNATTTPNVVSGSAGTPAGTVTVATNSAGTPAGTVTVANTGTAGASNYHPVAAVLKIIRAY